MKFRNRALAFILCAIVIGASARADQPVATTGISSAPAPQPRGASEPPVQQAHKPAASPYEQAMAKIFNPQALAEFIKVADALIDQADPAEGEPKPLQMQTDSGVVLQFSMIKNELATMYYLSVSRNGEELHYSEAVKLASLFGDRVGLTHPIIVTEGEKPIFYCEWLIKPDDWKKYRKMMLQQRTTNRQIKDPVIALNVAIKRELEARSASSKP